MTTQWQTYTPLYDSDGIILYEGDFVEGMRDGQGRWYRSDGALEYEGKWWRDDYSGSGRLFFFDDGDYAGAGYRYEGDFIEGMRHGQGRLYRPDDTLEYEGGWQEDHYHSRGKSYHRDGTTIEYEGAFCRRHAPWPRKVVRARRHP